MYPARPCSPPSNTDARSRCWSPPRWPGGYRRPVGCSTRASLIMANGLRPFHPATPARPRSRLQRPWPVSGGTLWARRPACHRWLSSWAPRGMHTGLAREHPAWRGPHRGRLHLDPRRGELPHAADDHRGISPGEPFHLEEVRWSPLGFSLGSSRGLGTTRRRDGSVRDPHDVPGAVRASARGAALEASGGGVGAAGVAAVGRADWSGARLAAAPARPGLPDGATTVAATRAFVAEMANRARA